MQKRFSVSDDDGLIAIVNAQRYNTFVSADWELEQLQRHFVEEMNRQNLIIWQTNNDGGGVWNVVITDRSEQNSPFREFSKSIEVTSGELYLTTYSDLTYAAQFEDERIPSKENTHMRIELANGFYQVKVKQLFNPDDYSNFYTDKPAFDISFRITTPEHVSEVEKVFWW